MRGKCLVLLFACAVLLWAGAASAAPSIYGPKGLFRVLSADCENQGTLSMNLHLTGFSQPMDTGYIETDGDTIHDRASDTYAGGQVFFTLSYAILDVWSLYYGGSLIGDAIDTDNLSGRTEYPVGKYLGYDNRRSIGLSDMQFGTNVSWPLFPKESTAKLYLGLNGFASIPTGAKWKMEMANDTIAWKKMDIGSIEENQGGVIRFFSSNGFDGGGSFLLTFQTPGEVPVLFHGNVGYIYRSYAPDMIGSQLLAGVGTEVRVGYVTPFIEFTTEQWLQDSNDSLGTSPMRISPGIRFSTPFGMGLDLGADFRVSSENSALPDTHFYVTTGLGAAPPWVLHFGISYLYDLIVVTPPKAPEKGEISGKVSDSETEEPLGATISFPSDTTIQSTTSDPATGLYKITVPPGTYRIHVEKNGYKYKDVPVEVVNTKTSLVDVALTKKVVAKGEITGKVMDASNSQPLGATLRFPGTDVPDVASDLATGIYKNTLPPGTYTVEAVADGYISQALPVVIEKDKTTIQNFELLKKGGKITLRGINFDTGKATIKPESFPILDQAVELLNKNPKVRVEIQGHTDSVGSDSYNLRLSDARAASVYQYLVSHGIDPTRLSSKGYGETMPIAPNTTTDGRAQNRRIDFQILEQ